MTNYLSIGVKTDSQTLIEQALLDASVIPLIVEAKERFGIHVLIVDHRQNFEMTQKFLEENDLEDENEFFRIFNIDDFGLMIDFEAPRINEYPELHTLVFNVAQQTSKVLEVQTIFMKSNLEVPVALFDCGKLVQEW